MPTTRAMKTFILTLTEVWNVQGEVKRKLSGEAKKYESTMRKYEIVEEEGEQLTDYVVDSVVVALKGAMSSE